MNVVLTFRRPGLVLLGVGFILVGVGLVNWPRK
jgi:hypothetical protein